MSAVTSTPAIGYSFTSPVGHYPQGESPYGVRDMAGNVWEWVADWYHSEYYTGEHERNPLDWRMER